MPWGGHGLNVGDVYFLDQTTAGGVTTAQPATGIVQEIFTVWDAGSIMIDLNQVRNSVRTYEAATPNAVAGHWYFIELGGTATLPAGAVAGDTIRFFSKGASNIAPNVGQTINGSASTHVITESAKITECTLVAPNVWVTKQLDKSVQSLVRTSDLTITNGNSHFFELQEIHFDKSGTGNTDATLQIDDDVFVGFSCWVVNGYKKAVIIKGNGTTVMAIPTGSAETTAQWILPPNCRVRVYIPSTGRCLITQEGPINAGYIPIPAAAEPKTHHWYHLDAGESFALPNPSYDGLSFRL